MTEDRIAAATDAIGDADGSRSAVQQVLRAFASECEEAGAYVECPTCGGDPVERDPFSEYPEGLCSTCDGEGRIRRELVGVVWAAMIVYERKADQDELVRRACVNWGDAKPKEPR